MHGFQLNALCLILSCTVAIAGEADPDLSRSDNSQEWQAQNQNRPYYPQQGFAPPRGQAPRYRPMETHPAAPPQYGEYPVNQGTGYYGYPDAYPQQEYYPPYPTSDQGNAYYYPTTPGYGQGYAEPQPYSYPYVYEQAPDYGGYPGQSGYGYQPGYQDDGYYPQPAPVTGPEYGDRYTPQAYDYPPAYSPGGYPQQSPATESYPPAAPPGWDTPAEPEYAAPPAASYNQDYPGPAPGTGAEAYRAQPADPTHSWRAAGQPTSPPEPGPGQAPGYLVNGQPAVFRPWSEPTTDTLTSPQRQDTSSE
ncbi:MAG: hypothetical protein OQL28_12640 [Sedimenticola sp.]|nr:hypothetical protein [Sedimenticola sp.]